MSFISRRADLGGGRVSDYAPNTVGVANLLSVLASASPPVRRVVVGSSRMVCRIGYQPSSNEDYCPSTAYGASKVETERLVRRVADLPWVLVRPTSIWGPWFDTPYRDFFLSIARGRYIHPAGRAIHKHFGFVANTIWQLHRVMTASEEDVLGRTFYLADDPPIEVREFADRISTALGCRRAKDVPLPVLRTLALAGDALQRTGCRAPLTSFRLANLLTPMIYDLAPLTRLAGPPPCPLDASVPATISWLRSQRLGLSRGDRR